MWPAGGLTPAQAARYHARLSRMYADQATHFADLAVMYARRGERVALIGGGLVLLFAIFGVIGASSRSRGRAHDHVVGVDACDAAGP
jgi:precorrin-3B methylase